jgi:hypothetical protein
VETQGPGESAHPNIQSIKSQVCVYYIYSITKHQNKIHAESLINYQVQNPRGPKAQTRKFSMPTGNQLPFQKTISMDEKCHYTCKQILVREGENYLLIHIVNKYILCALYKKCSKYANTNVPSVK